MRSSLEGPFRDHPFSRCGVCELASVRSTTNTFCGSLRSGGRVAQGRLRPWLGGRRRAFARRGSGTGRGLSRITLWYTLQGLLLWGATESGAARLATAAVLPE
ncbi:hypothetical protein HPB50_010482 [Hyalomma asiaticum]|uniref:Uncharacterized protein n=1 Tax=Hyalomma asiaticum TaxID=266040 RepID=A0ACB7SJN6_HYAAI|nr:hypothetical protein HPB50_010482 [Hyalomma asiaticum]